MQKLKKFLYLILLMSSLSSWWVELSWLNFQLSQVTLNWKYMQFDSSWVENVSNLTLN